MKNIIKDERGNIVLVMAIIVILIFSVILLFKDFIVPVYTEVMPVLELESNASAAAEHGFTVSTFFRNIKLIVALAVFIIVAGLIIVGIRHSTKKEYDTGEIQ